MKKEIKITKTKKVTTEEIKEVEFPLYLTECNKDGSIYRLAKMVINESALVYPLMSYELTFFSDGLFGAFQVMRRDYKELSDMLSNDCELISKEEWEKIYDVFISQVNQIKTLITNE